MSKFYRLNETTWINIEEISSIFMEPVYSNWRVTVRLKSGFSVSAEKEVDCKAKAEKEVNRLLNITRRLNATAA